MAVLSRAIVVCLALCLTLVLDGAGIANASTSPVQARAGQLDLAHWDFERKGMASLEGDWLFGWGVFEDPLAAQTDRDADAGRLLIPVPGSWHGLHVAGVPLGSDGYGTYRLRVKCDRGLTGLALALPTQHSAMRLFVNGRELASQGSPGSSAQTSRPAVSQQYVPLAGTSCPLDIVVHVSNFDHRRGGLVRGLQLGTHQQMLQRRESGLVRDMLALV